MPAVDERILRVIREHHVFTLAVSAGNIPYCASCFYVYREEKNLFVFTSDPDTRHIRDILRSGNFYVAGAIALETKITGRIRGIQFNGPARRLEGEELALCKKAYRERFPVATLAILHLWGIEPDFMKLTDNRLGFGKKLIWKAGNGG